MKNCRTVGAFALFVPLFLSSISHVGVLLAADPQDSVDVGCDSWIEGLGMAYSYDEASDGDLSSDATSPTVIPFEGAGGYMITGQTVNYQGPNADPEYFSIDIPAGYEVTAIRMMNWDQSDYLNSLPDLQLPFGNGGFFGIGEGSSLPVIVSPDDFPAAADALSGGALVGIIPGTAAGDDVIDNLQAGFNFDPITIPGFIGNLGEGTYTFFLKEGFPDAAAAANFTSFSLMLEIAHEDWPAGVNVVEGSCNDDVVVRDDPYVGSWLLDTATSEGGDFNQPGAAVVSFLSDRTFISNDSAEFVDG
ncbi:MAG: hypothetical protein ACI9DF_000187, partial [Verrucomicrobiales bacterium]